MAQDVTDTPICTQIINEGEYSVRGTIATARAIYEGSDDDVLNGTLARHEENFNIPPQGRWDVCSRGPFYEGKRLELTIRSLIPLFTCQTNLYEPIIIRDMRDSAGEYKVWATCH